MESRLALVRAAHLNSYISVLRDIGAPVDRELGRSKLPGNIEETPDLYVSLPVALDWIGRTGRDLEIMELGLIAARKASLSSLRLAQQAAIMTAQTGLRRLEAVAAVARFEDSALAMSIRREGTDVRVFCSMPDFARHPCIGLSEWLNLQAVISVVRSVEGPSWQPGELSFVSSRPPPVAVQAQFPDARILVGQADTSVLVESAFFTRQTDVAIVSGDEQPEHSQAWNFACLLRSLLQPYLSEGRPDVAFAAEMAGMSVRTLQRKLSLCGSSYSQVLQEARFELACRRLDEPGLKVVEIAMISGYDSPQHFTRAFRRFVGLTPSQYRHQLGTDAAPETANARGGWG